MNPLPDIVVLDFCEWLKHKIDADKTRSVSLLDILIGDGNGDGYLRKYAHEFLSEKKSECRLKTVIQQFLVSKEFRRLTDHCKKDCLSFNKCNYYDVLNCLHYYDIDDAFYCFITRTQNYEHQQELNDISEYDLANYMKRILHSDNKIRSSPQFLQLMTSSKTEIAEELNFFEWLQDKLTNPIDVIKMPADIFERYVDGYINSCGKSAVEKRHLLKSYRQTGWENLLEKIRVILHINKTQRTKSLAGVAERYYSKCPRFKCILLPLSDKESQKHYRSLITDSWNDLNDLSGDYLDIYYSELDTGKSGYDIAKRINSLPISLKSKAPCLIIWDYNIHNAQYIPLDELNSIQIICVIRSVVNCIIEKNNLQDIVKEASEKVSEIQEANHGVKKYYGPVITGDGNVVGDNNAVGTGNVVGDANNISGNTIAINSDESYIKKLIDELDQAILAIKSSLELDDDLKAQMCGIITEAKDGTLENSEEKQKSAKTAFRHVKTFLTKIAPNLISTLANLATISTFFGLTA